MLKSDDDQPEGQESKNNKEGEVIYDQPKFKKQKSKGKKNKFLGRNLRDLRSLVSKSLSAMDMSQLLSRQVRLID